MKSINVGRLNFRKSPEGEVTVIWMGHGTPLRSDPSYRAPTGAELQALEDHLAQGYQWVPVTP